MTEREKQLINAYLPSPPDETLEFGEYYIFDDRDYKVKRVYVRDIGVGDYGDTVYGLRFSHNNQMYHGGCGYLTQHMYELYDNKEDCRNSTHLIYDDWERLRKIQREANA